MSKTLTLPNGDHEDVEESDASAPPPAATGAATSAPSPVVEYVAQAPDVTHAAPARMAPVIKYMASAHLAPSFCRLVNPQFSSGLVNPQVPATCVEASAPESTRSIPGLPSGQEQARVQEIPEVQISERIRQQTVLERIEDQVGDIPFPPIVDETVEVLELFPESVDERIVDFPDPPMVKGIPITVSSSHDAAHAAPTLVNECAMSPMRHQLPKVMCPCTTMLVKNGSRRH